MVFWNLLLVITSVSAEFDLRDASRVNWTTCEDFVKNYSLDVNRIVDIDWKIFYFWDLSSTDSYNVRFSVPTVGLIDRYRVELASEMKDVNWNDSVLFMETSVDFSALYLRTNVSSIYRVVPNLAFDSPNCPYMAFALKVVDPGYLGIMNCKYRVACALAPVERMPRDDQITEAAAKLLFWNSLGHSYLMRPQPQQLQRYEDDDIDDEELEIDRHFNNL